MPGTPHPVRTGRLAQRRTVGRRAAIQPSPSSNGPQLPLSRVLAMCAKCALSHKATTEHSPRVPCYMCYMCYISQGNPLNIHSPRVPCYMSAFSASKAMACVTSRSRCLASRYNFRGSLTLKLSARSLSASIWLCPKKELVQGSRDAGRPPTCCCPKKELAQGSRDAGRPTYFLAHTYLLQKRGLIKVPWMQGSLHTPASCPKKPERNRISGGHYFAATRLHAAF